MKKRNEVTEGQKYGKLTIIKEVFPIGNKRRILCKCDMSYGGGLILVAANNVEEAYLTAAMDKKVSYMFDWADDEGIWCEPDGNIDHCWSMVYPLGKWFEVEHLSTDLTEPQVIIEGCYYE